MKLFKRFKAQIEANQEATRKSEKLLAELEMSEPHVDEQHQKAVNILNESENQARRLRAANHRNHYSEGLTQSFQGRAAT